MPQNEATGDVFGQKIEIPVPLYAQGVLFGLFSLHNDQRYLALRRGQPDQPSSYLRCISIHRNGSVTRYDSTPIDNEGHRREVIPPDQITRILVLCRSRIDQGFIGYLSGQSERSAHEQTVLAFSSYLFAVSVGVEMARDPSLTFSVWVARQSPSYQEKLQEILGSGVLDRCIELHRLHYLPRQ